MGRNSEHDADRTRLYQLLQQNKRLIASVIRRFTLNPSDIEDITQETILRAIEAQERTRIEHPRQFLVGIARNVAREELKKRTRITQRILEDCDINVHPSEEPSAESVLDGKEKLRLFAQAVGNLPPQCRKVFVLKHAYGASHKEIAKKLGISVSTVEKHVAHGLNTCRKQMLAKLNGAGEGEEIEVLFDASMHKTRRR